MSYSKIERRIKILERRAFTTKENTKRRRYIKQINALERKMKKIFAES